MDSDNFNHSFMGVCIFITENARLRHQIPVCHDEYFTGILKDNLNHKYFYMLHDENNINHLFVIQFFCGKKTCSNT